jgi:hypothetical protein
VGRNQISFRDPKRTYWEAYKDDLRANLETLSWYTCMIRDVNGSDDQLQWAIISS